MNSKLIIFGAIFIIFLTISSATAVSKVNSEPLMYKIENIKDINEKYDSKKIQERLSILTKKIINMYKKYKNFDIKFDEIKNIYSNITTKKKSQIIQNTQSREDTPKILKIIRILLSAIFLLPSAFISIPGFLMVGLCFLLVIILRNLEFLKDSKIYNFIGFIAVALLYIGVIFSLPFGICQIILESRGEIGIIEAADLWIGDW